MKIQHLFATVLLLVCISCTKSKTEAISVIAQMTGKQIVFPEELTYQVWDKEIEYNPSEADYKIVVYIDSTGCTTCKMKMPLWEKIISDYKSLASKEVNFVMILNTNLTPEFLYALKQKDFMHPVCFDPENRFDLANNLPDQDEYHTLLLDSSDKVVAIGNPAENPKIKKLYDDIIGVKTPSEAPMCFSYSRSLGVVSAKRVTKLKYRLKNPSDSILSVEAVIPSCDCTQVSISADTIPPHGNLTVSVDYMPDSLETGPFHQYIDVFFNERPTPERLTFHGYIKQ